MRKNSLIAALAALATTTACVVAAGGTGYTGGTGKKIQHQAITPDSSAVCTSQRCKVEIVVGDDCKVEAKPYFLIMTGKRPVTVLWQVSKNATFAQDGVYFKETLGKKVFRVDRKLSDRNEIVFVNDMKNGIYHYGVRVAVGDRECPVLDPTGVNDMVTDGPDPGP